MKKLTDIIEYVGKDYYLKESKTFCMLPWVHMYVNTDSSVWSCCVNKTMTLGDHEYELTNIMSQPVIETMNSEYFKKLRLDMINDIENDNCTDCFKLEKSTGHSYRNDFNREYGDYFDKVPDMNTDGSLDDFETIYLDFRFSNLCNFKCRSCRPEWSSNWAKEAKDNKDHPYKDWDGYIPRHDLTEEEFIDKFKDAFKTIKRIYFAGGEPLAAKEHYWILNYLIENNNTDVIVEYNTNLSMLKNNKLKLSVVDYWKKFSNISIRVSLDAKGDRAEYLRSGTDWKLIEDNYRYVKENLPNVNIGISTVFQLTNALHIPDFYQDWIDKGLLDEEGLHNIFVIPLTGPEQLSSHILSKELKTLVRDRWKDFMDRLGDIVVKDLQFKLKKYISDCLDYMDSEDLYNSQKIHFENYTKYLDNIRSENFSEVFPELKDYYDC